MSKSTKPATTQLCAYEISKGVDPKKARHKLDKFSLVKGQEGVYHTTCKACRVILSKVWTDRRADMRKLQTQARQINAKAQREVVRIPLAKTYKAGDVLRFKNGTVYRPKAARVRTKATSATASA